MSVCGCKRATVQFITWTCYICITTFTYVYHRLRPATIWLNLISYYSPRMVVTTHRNRDRPTTTMGNDLTENTSSMSQYILRPTYQREC